MNILYRILYYIAYFLARILKRDTIFNIEMYLDDIYYKEIEKDFGMRKKHFFINLLFLLRHTFWEASLIRDAIQKLKFNKQTRPNNLEIRVKDLQEVKAFIEEITALLPKSAFVAGILLFIDKKINSLNRRKNE